MIIIILIAPIFANNNNNNNNNNVTCVISSISSLANRPPTSPVDKMLFIYSRKLSSLISLSVKRKEIPSPLWPAFR